MKCIPVHIISFFLYVTGSAQTTQGSTFTNQVMGKVADSSTLQPVPFVTASLLDRQQVIVKNSISDSLGNFIITGIAAGTYYLQISAVGYTPLITALLMIKETSVIDLGTFRLAKEAGLLEEVVVSKPLISNSADGFSYNAANDIIPAGTTAGDLLRRVPMLMADQNGNPILRGSTNIRVFIDDKPSEVYAPTVADALKQIPAEDIVRVDVILYPSAKYDAEGTDGVINIITRKSRFNAVNGNLRGCIGNVQSNFMPDLSIRQGNWIINANAGVAYYRSPNGSHLSREDNSGGIKNNLQQQAEWKNQGKIFYTGANIIYVFNDLHSVNAGYRYRFSRDYNDRITANTYYQNDSLVTSFIRNTDMISGNNVHSTFFGYNGKSRNRKQEYSLLASYFMLKGPDEYDMDQLREGIIDYRELFRGQTSNSELSLQADYVYKISDSLSWDAGIKSQSRRFGTINSFDVFDLPSGAFVKDAGRFSQFIYNRDIYAAYSDISMRFKKWQVRAGIRHEQTRLHMQFKDTALTVPDYNNFTPSVVISKTFGKLHVVKWSYGKRISRPLAVLNPSVNYIDSFNLQSGNPDLQPEIINRYEMSYTLNGRRLFFIASLFYNVNHNALESVRLPLGNGIFLNTYQSIGHNDVLGLSMSVTWKWQQKFSLNSTITFRENYMESKALQQSVRAFNVNGNLTATYQFNKGYSLQGMTYLGLDDYTLQGKRENWQFYSLIATKKFKGDRVALTFRTDNFLSPAHQSLTQTWASPQFKQAVTTRYQNTYFFIGFSWKLGKKEVKAPAVRQDSGE